MLTEPNRSGLSHYTPPQTLRSQAEETLEQLAALRDSTGAQAAQLLGWVRGWGAEPELYVGIVAAWI